MLCAPLVYLFLDTDILPLSSTRNTNLIILQRLERVRQNFASANLNHLVLVSRI